MARGRKPSVRYWDSRGGYCAWVNGRRELLARGPDDAPNGPTYLAALDRFRKLLAMEAGKGTDDYLVSSLLNQYRVHLQETRKSAVPGVFEVMARGFGRQFGRLKVCELQPNDFGAWLRKQKQWNDTSKAHAVTLILAAISWAQKKNLIKTNPLAGRVERPQPVLRGREASMPDALMDLLIAEAYANKMKSREWGDLLKFLRLTGARPGELRAAEAFNYEKGRIVFRWNTTRGYVHKTARKTQRDRIIYLTPELQAYVEGLVAKNPTGPIFRTPRGRQWSPTSVANKWRWLVRRPEVVAYCRDHGIDPNGLKPYFFRHSFLSRWVEQGGDIYIAAQLCGTSVKMIENRYGHPNVDRLHERYMQFMGVPPVTTTRSPADSTAAVAL